MTPQQIRNEVEKEINRLVLDKDFIDKEYDVFYKEYKNAVDNFDLSKNELEITGENAKQMAQVLKLKIGEKIELCDGKGISAIAEITKINKKSVLVKLEEFLHQNKDKQEKALL